MRLKVLGLVCLLSFATNCRPRNSGSSLRSLGDVNEAYVSSCRTGTLLVQQTQPSGATQFGLTDEATDNRSQRNNSLPKTVKDVFTSRGCVDCHFSGSSDGANSFNDILDVADLRRGGLISSTDPQTTRLFQALTRKGENYMPLGGERLPQSELNLIADWIRGGASDPNVETTILRQRQIDFISEADKISCILNDFKSLDRSHAKFARYFTLTHLYNTQSDSELEVYRNALSKLVNSLSRGPRIIPPFAIDSAKTVYRIDLRLFKWDRNTWNDIVDSDPYSFKYTDRRSEELYDAVDGDIPYVRADWFVSAGSVPPLYHLTLKIPSDVSTLEQQLGVSVENNIRDNFVTRSGFDGITSQVSNNNRMIERHDASFGAYWKSYDFASNSGQQNLFLNPLGPCGMSGITPSCFNDFDLRSENIFSHDGGEMIFNLPNGLQGYMLVNRNGDRIDRAPVEIVSDVKRRDRAVINGQSCMGCHINGIIPQYDQIRQVVLANQRAFRNPDKILALYREKQHLDKLIQLDQKRYRTAIEQTGGEITAKDPVFSLAAYFDANPIDFLQAAAELGFKPGELRSKIENNFELNKLMLRLLVPNGSVSRDFFQQNFSEIMELLRNDLVDFNGRGRRINFRSRF